MAGRSFTVEDNAVIVLADGTRLGARIWMPDDAGRDPVPAVLEFLPYRKRDGTAPRDESTYPVFARAGYAGVRVDIRGSGESDGVIDGEYTPCELADACEVIGWIAAQPWCTGAVGMMGISWGGFNALQAAALRPPALKAVISIASTVDRYNDDIHYKNGCHLSANLSWAATMLCYQSRPPDPALVGDRWRAMWIERLEGEPFMLEEWLEHQRRDDFWRHGSICEDFTAVDIPVLVIAGWADGYRNTPLDAVEGLGGLAKAIIGPWVHKYPHFAWPKPRMDFHAEAIAWWDRWLKGIDNGADAAAQVRAYILDGPHPAPLRSSDPGRWIAIDRWSPPGMRHLFADAGRRLVGARSVMSLAAIAICSPQDTGTAAGEFFALKPDAEMAGDQRGDDAGSVVFETDALAEAVEVLGRPVLHIAVSADAPCGMVAARLVDIHPDGSATRVSFGVLNLAHRHGNAAPEAVAPGETMAVRLRLDACGYRFGPGHRIRLALSSVYWPLVLPPPQATTLSLDPGSLCLDLPALGEATAIELPEPADPDPLPRYIEHAPAATQRTVERDLSANRTSYRIVEDTGLHEHPDTGLSTRTTRRETWSISPADPLSMTGCASWTAEMRRGDWSVRSDCEARIACTATEWLIEAWVTAHEGDEQIHRMTWSRRIPRDFM
jgi:putative CocE/NonD family hydrolase